jgi:hypothetical protein
VRLVYVDEAGISDKKQELLVVVGHDLFPRLACAG